MIIVNFFLENRSQVKVSVNIVCMSGKPLSQGTYMPNMKALSEQV